MLGEAVYEGDDASSAWEDSPPIFKGEIGSDDRACAFVPAADDAVEQVAGACIAWEVSEFIQDQDVWRGVALHAPVDCGQ